MQSNGSGVYALWAVLTSATLTACNDPKTFAPATSDSFLAASTDQYSTAANLKQADYLFVLDFSRSMAPYSQDIAASMVDFADALEDENIDYRVGIALGTQHSTAQVNGQGQALPLISLVYNDFLGGILTPSNFNVTQSSIINATSGLGGVLAPNENFTLEAGLRTLQNRQSSFLRAAAQLVLVFVANSDDETQTFSGGSNRTPSYYVSQYRAFKSHPSYISSRAFLALNTSSCPVDPVNNGEAPAPRIAEVSRTLDSVATSPFCLNSIRDNLVPTLENLAQTITRPTNRFTLQGSALANTVRVFVNGSERLPGSGGWNFNTSTNEVVFSSQPPANQDSVRIEYDSKYVLSRRPLASTIEVQVNGRSVQPSDTNGFVYIESENRIEFRGNAKPNHGDNIRVSYQL